MMNENDLISRAAAIECAIDAVDDWEGGWNPTRETVIRKYFEELPAVDAVPVVHGWWVDNDNGTISCSRCATWFQKEREPYLLFCGYCAAKMGGECND